MDNKDFKEYWNNLSVDEKLEFVKVSNELKMPLDKYQQELVDEFAKEVMDAVRNIMDNLIYQFRKLLLDENFIAALNEALENLEEH